MAAITSSLLSSFDVYRSRSELRTSKAGGRIAATRHGGTVYDLRHAVGRVGMTHSAPARATLEDVARAAGVSLATADRVVNRREGVRVKTVARVEAAIA